MLERRPSMVLVTGVPSNTDKEELLTHFRKYGEVADTADQVSGDTVRW